MKWNADFAAEDRKGIHLLGSLLAKSSGLTIRAIAAQAWILKINIDLDLKSSNFTDIKVFVECMIRFHFCTQTSLHVSNSLYLILEFLAFANN